jgi:hypothetical protein
MTRAGRIIGASAVLLAAVGAVAMSPGSPAGAASSFRGVASADAVRVVVIVPNFPVTSSVVDFGKYSAQAVVTSNNESQAFASTPYPGEGVVTLPGTLAGFGAAGIPAYPFYASSVHPDRPHAQVGDGPFKLVADSNETTSESTASSGVSGDQNIGAAVTTASVKRSGDGSVVATAQSRVDGFTAQGVRIASVLSSTTTKLLPDGTLERSSSLDITGLTVNNVSVRLTKDGLVVGDQAVPVNSGAINDALKQAGVSIAYIAPEETPSGIVGAGVRITAAVEVPGSGVVNISWILGRSLSVIDAAGLGEDLVPELPAEDLPPEPPAASEETSPAVAQEAPASEVAGAFDSGTAFTGSDSGAVSGSLGTTSGYEASSPGAEAFAPTPAAEAPGPAGDVPLAAASTAPGSLSANDTSGIFLLLVAGAAAVVVLSQVLGLLGVRLR